VNDVNIHFDAGAEHADGIEHTFLTVDEEMLANHVNDAVLGGEIDRLGVLNCVLDVLLHDLTIM
jgi:hypothetical protein